MRSLKYLFTISTIVVLFSACSKTAGISPVPLTATADNGYEASQKSSTPFELQGFCDASAAVSIAPGTFVVANDEDNLLRVYNPLTSREPLSTFDLRFFLAVATQ